MLLFTAISFLLNRQGWAQLKAPIPKNWRVGAIVFTVVFIVFMLWQALYMPKELRRTLDDAATSLFAVGVLWVATVAAILLAWIRARHAGPGSVD